MSGTSRRAALETIVSCAALGCAGLVSHLSSEKESAEIKEVSVSPFQTGAIQVPELGVKVTLPSENRLWVEYADDVNLRTDEISEEYGVSDDAETSPALAGRYMAIEKKMG